MKALQQQGWLWKRVYLLPKKTILGRTLWDTTGISASDPKRTANQRWNCLRRRKRRNRRRLLSIGQLYWGDIILNRQPSSGVVKLGDDYRINCEGKGTVHLDARTLSGQKSPLKMSDILYVPSLGECNLMLWCAIKAQGCFFLWVEWRRWYPHSQRLEGWGNCCLGKIGW